VNAKSQPMEIEEAVIDMNNFDHTVNDLNIDNLRLDDRDTTN